jgi:hypothetical protein
MGAALHSDLVSSMIRSARSGAAWDATFGQWPNASISRTELSSRATVRPFANISGAPQRTTSNPACSKPIAATKPANPAPTTRMSQERGACAAWPISKDFQFGGPKLRPRLAKL